MGKTSIMKIMERACGHEVKTGDRVWCNVDLASARDFGGINSVLEFEKEMGKDAKVWNPNRIAFTFDLQAPAHSEKVSNRESGMYLTSITASASTQCLKRGSSSRETSCSARTVT